MDEKEQHMGISDLTGKTILVTGASSGIGRQTAISISTCGGKVIITGRNHDRLTGTLASMKGGSHQYFAADLTIPEQRDALVDFLPELNGVVYSTGISDLVPSQFISPDDIRKNFSIGFDASVLLTAALLRKKKLVKQACSLVFISTLATRYPFFGGTLYIAAKAALESYARTLALELAPKGIRVNCLSPAFVKGPMMEETEGKISKEAMDKFLERQPFGLGDPADVAGAVVYFLSDSSQWVTGSNLPLGGS
jgi:NAD(P)-dependent dehydrogenase (short-subunit alcohol dehydrogenase family)